MPQLGEVHVEAWDDGTALVFRARRGGDPIPVERAFRETSGLMRSVMLAVLALGLASGGVAIWAASGRHWIAVVVCGLDAVILAGFAAVALATDWKNAQWRHGDHIRLDVAAYSRFAADLASEIVHARRRDDGSIDQDHPDVVQAGDRLWYRAGALGTEER